MNSRKRTAPTVHVSQSLEANASMDSRRIRAITRDYALSRAASSIGMFMSMG
jgi:hypothetical protein